MKKYIVVFCWSFSVLAALFIGQALNQPANYIFFNPESNASVTQLEWVEADVNGVLNEKSAESILPDKPVKRVNNASAAKPVSINSVMDDLERYFSGSQYNNFDNYQNMADTWERIKSLDEEQLYDIYSQLDSANEKGINWNVGRILVSRMGELDPGRAIAFAVSKKQSYAVQGVIHSWSKEKPLEALEWIQNNKDSFSASSNIDYYRLFNNVAKVDTDKALESLKNFDLSKQRNALKGILTSLETNEDFLKVIGQFDDFEDNGEKLSSALYYWGQKSPKDALAFAQTIESEQERKNAERKIEVAWVRSNPEEAASWILENRENKDSAFSNIINNWDWRKSEKLYEWVQNNADTTYKDSANYNLIKKFSYNNSDLAQKALENIESDEMRKKAVTQIYKSLRYRNQKAAAEFLNGRSEIPEAEKEKLLSSKSYRRY